MLHIVLVLVAHFPAVIVLTRSEKCFAPLVSSSIRMRNVPARHTRPRDGLLERHDILLFRHDCNSLLLTRILRASI